MALCCWSLAALISIPMLFMFHTIHITDPVSIFYNKMVCESLFRYRPISHRQAFLTFIAIMHVFLPCCAICTCYVRIYLKISQKAEEASGGVTSLKSGKIHLQSTSSSLPRAKIKTLKMTVVIVTIFLLCGLPYHVMELLFNFWKHDYIPKVVTAIMGALPVANSVINPYIFLLFNVNEQCLRSVVRPNPRRAHVDSKQEHSLHSHTDSTAVSLVRCNNYSDRADRPPHDKHGSTCYTSSHGSYTAITSIDGDSTFLHN